MANYGGPRKRSELEELLRHGRRTVPVETRKGGRQPEEYEEEERFASLCRRRHFLMDLPTTAAVSSRFLSSIFSVDLRRENVVNHQEIGLFRG